MVGRELMMFLKREKKYFKKGGGIIYVGKDGIRFYRI